MDPLSIVIVGSGYRALLFAQVIKRHPEHFCLKYLLCRTEEKAKWIAEKNQIPTTTSVEICQQSRPDFVVIAVNRESSCAVIKEWTGKGFPVLIETPTGASLEELKMIWKLKTTYGARIQAAEQYRRYPIIAAGLKELDRGKIGEPYAVALSVAHDYHAASLIRRMLRISAEPMKLRGSRYAFPVTQTNSRYGPITDGSVQEFYRDHVTIEFASGKAAFYDFTGVQYRTFIRARHLSVQGRDGEWNDSILRFVGEDHLPVTETIIPYLDPKYQMLETEEILEICSRWNPFLELEEDQDRYAIATMLYDMRAYLNGGEEVYSLAEALEDDYTWLLMKQAAENPGSLVESERMPWHEELCRNQCVTLQEKL